MTPSQIQALIGMWQLQNKNGGDRVYAEDVAVAISLCVGTKFGKARAASALRALQDMKFVKETAWHTFKLTKKGRVLCRAVGDMAKSWPMEF